MADDRFDFPDSPAEEGGDGTRRRGTGRPRRWLWLALGLALGVAAALLAPPYLGPHLPGFLGLDRTVIRGQVVETERGDDRLLLTVDSDRGAMLVTFRRRVAEIDLLVAPGDSIVLRAGDFRPFLEEPELVGVRKGRWGAPGSAPPPETAAPGDTAAGGDGPADAAGAPEAADPEEGAATGGDTGAAARDTGGG